MTLFRHQVDGELAGELDEAVVPRLGDDEDVLDVGLDARAAWAAGIVSDRSGGGASGGLTELLAHLAHADGGLCELFCEAATGLVVVDLFVLGIDRVRV